MDTMAMEKPQHMRALDRANEVRLARAELKRQIVAGKKTVVGVLKDGPMEAETMTLSELLCAQRRWGLTRARKLLATIPLHENKAVGTLTPRQRRLLIREMEE